MILQDEAIATPPTKVACCKSYNRIPFPCKAVTIKTPIVLPVRAQYVLITIVVLSYVF